MRKNTRSPPRDQTRQTILSKHIKTNSSQESVDANSSDSKSQKRHHATFAVDQSTLGGNTSQRGNSIYNEEPFNLMNQTLYQKPIVKSRKSRGDNNSTKRQIEAKRNRQLLGLDDGRPHTHVDPVLKTSARDSPSVERSFRNQHYSVQRSSVGTVNEDQK